MTETAEQRIVRLDIVLPVPATPVANFIPAVLVPSTDDGTTALLFISGQITAWNGQIRYVGRVGESISLDEAREGARICALNILAQAKAHLGSLDRVTRVVQVQGFVNAVPTFGEHPAVINGASDVFVQVFGTDIGKHTRFAVGAGSLPFNVAVEVAAVLAVTRT